MYGFPKTLALKKKKSLILHCLKFLLEYSFTTDQNLLYRISTINKKNILCPYSILSGIWSQVAMGVTFMTITVKRAYRLEALS